MTWPRSTSYRLMPRSSRPTFSPASAVSSSLRNISMPVTVVVCLVSLIPTISTVSLTFSTPRSTLPVTTVPRPVIVNTSSIGIKNGFSRSRCGSGTDSSTPPLHATTLPSHPELTPPRHQVQHLPLPHGVTLQRLQRRHPHHRSIITGELVLVEQLP